MADGSDDTISGDDIGFAPTLDGRQTEIDDAPAQRAHSAHPTPASSREHDAVDGRGRGDILEGVYEVIDVLSEAGGMARVFLARDLRLGRQVVVKMTRASGFDAEKRALFEREARATARLKHRNIVTIHAFGFWGDSPYMVLEYLEGQSLRERLEDGAFGEADAIRTMIPLARALHHAHERGVFHRDIKPDNIFLEESGEVKLLDFGISDFNLDKQAVRDALESGGELIDGTPAVAGTPGFMAPEQWRGESQDARTDVWGIGATLYCMLGGRCPYPPQVPTRLFTDGVPSIREHADGISNDTADLVDRCLHVPVEERFASAEALLNALQGVRDALTMRGEVSGAPYRYLQAFEEGEAGWFFGRDAETARLQRLVDANPLTALIGPSGAGKSSLVRAGLLPKMRERSEVRALHVRPENRPLERLRTELDSFTGLDSAQDDASLMRQPGLVGRKLRDFARDHDADVVLVVDQLEELFTGDVDDSRRQAFVDAICSASDDSRSRVRVVVTMREDFLSRLARFPTLQRRVTENLLLLGAPDADAQREMMVKPAERLGFAWPDAIVDSVLEEVADDPTPLPSLQIAASRLWELRDEEHQTIPPDALDRIGGVAGALSSHADDIVDRLQSTAELRVAREVFCILVGREETRRAMLREDLLERFFDRNTAERVLEHLISGRLLAVSSFEGETSVELAHDALIDRWDRLEGWLRDDAESRRLRERLAEAARHWDSEGRPSELLWEGETLKRTLEWESADARDISVVEHDFLEDSRQAIERRTWLRRWAFIAGFVVVAGAFYYIGTGGQPEPPDRTPQYLTAAAQVLQTEPDLAAPFALRALDEKPSAQAATLLHAALERDHVLHRNRVEAGVRDAVFSRTDDAYLTVPNSGFSLSLRDLDAGENQPVGVQGELGAATQFDGVGTLFHRRNQAIDGIWCESPDGIRHGALGRVWAAKGLCRFPTASSDRKTVELVTVRDGESEREPIGGEWTEFSRASISRDGRHVLIVGERGPNDIDSSHAEWRADVFWTTGEASFSIAIPPKFELARLIPGRDDALLIAAGTDNNLGTALSIRPTAEDAPTPSVELDMSRQDLELQLSSDGQLALARSADGQASLVALGEDRLEQVADWDDIDHADFVDARTIALTSGTRVDLVAADGARLTTLRHAAPVHGWRTTESGERIVTWTASDAFVWSLDGRRLADTTAGHAIRGLAARDDGERLLVVTDAGVELHQMWGKPEGTLLQADAPIDHVRFAPGSTRVAVSDAAGSVRSIKLDGTAPDERETEHPVMSIRYRDAQIETLTLRDGALVAELGDETRRYDLPEEARVEHAEWDLSGQYVWATGRPSSLLIWKADTGERTVFRFDESLTEVRMDGYSGWFFVITDESNGRAGSINGALNPPIEWKGEFQDLIFEDSGMCVASIDAQGRTRLTRFGEIEGETQLDADGIRELAFAPDGSGLVTIDRAGSVVLWGIDGARKRELGLAPGAQSIAYGPNGDVIAATRPGATWLWSTKRRREIARVPAGVSTLSGDHFSPDGRFIALPDRQGALELYAIERALLGDIARGQIIRELSAAEYARFGLPDPVFDR